MMTPEAKKARNEYYKQWREKNRDKFNAACKKWQRANPDKIVEYQRRYWERKAVEQKKEGAENE